jgi:hypothetical protein
MLCSECRWYKGSVKVDRNGRASGSSECRRYPPLLFGGGDHTAAVMLFPKVSSDGWCREWAATTAD